MNDDAPLSLEELSSILRREYDNADSFHDTLEQMQDQAFRYYEGQPFGNEVEGRSQLVLPDVQESVDYMSASVLRTFVSGERTVEFEAIEEEHEQGAEEATEAINYNFMRQQDGYRILLDGTNDGLLKKMGIFKTCVETVERVVRERVTVDPLVLGEIEDELENLTENDDGSVTVTIKSVRRDRVFRDYAIPTNEFRFTPDARHEDDSDYLCHVCAKTRSELVDMGFDPEQAYSVPAYGRNSGDVDRTESDALDSHYTEESTSALERVLLCEEYARIDVDGDGIAERVKVYRVENEILIDAETREPSIETIDEQPFAVFCPFPRPHRMVGYSLADKVMDLQLARSFVGRQLFDGMAFANMPRLVVDESNATKNTYKDILSPIPGSPVRTKGGVASVQPLQTGFEVGKSLSVLEWITGERESRTGITRLNQGLDADTLNKTATGTALMQSQGQQQEEFIARNLAEAIGRLFQKKYRLMRREGVPIRLKVDGKYKEVDPSTWPEDVCMVVRVGLGSGSKDKRIQARMALLQPLMGAMEQGMAGPEHAFNWMDGMARDTELGKGDDFMFDPADPEVQQRMAQQGEKPDPEVLAKQAELQMKAQEAEGRLQLDTMKAETQAQLDREKAEASIQTEREKHVMQMEAARERAVLEMQLAREKTYAEIELAREKTGAEMALKKQQSDANLTDQRMGGSVAS